MKKKKTDDVRMGAADGKQPDSLLAALTRSPIVIMQIGALSGVFLAVMGSCYLLWANSYYLIGVDAFVVLLLLFIFRRRIAGQPALVFTVAFTLSVLAAYPLLPVLDNAVFATAAARAGIAAGASIKPQMGPEKSFLSQYDANQVAGALGEDEYKGIVSMTARAAVKERIHSPASLRRLYFDTATTAIFVIREVERQKKDNTSKNN